MYFTVFPINNHYVDCNTVADNIEFIFSVESNCRWINIAIHLRVVCDSQRITVPRTLHVHVLNYVNSDVRLHAQELHAFDVQRIIYVNRTCLSSIYYDNTVLRQQLLNNSIIRPNGSNNHYYLCNNILFQYLLK